MKRLTASLAIAFLFASSSAYADKYTDTIETFNCLPCSAWPLRQFSINQVFKSAKGLFIHPAKSALILEI
jgi:hypothetical protein